jgi:hypothetical protein
VTRTWWINPDVGNDDALCDRAGTYRVTRQDEPLPSYSSTEYSARSTRSSRRMFSNRLRLRVTLGRPVSGLPSFFRTALVL